MLLIKATLLVAMSALPLSLAKPHEAGHSKLHSLTGVTAPFPTITAPSGGISIYGNGTASHTGTGTGNPACPTVTTTAQIGVCERIACGPVPQCVIASTTTIPCGCPSVAPTVTVKGLGCGGCQKGCKVAVQTKTAEEC